MALQNQSNFNVIIGEKQLAKTIVYTDNGIEFFAIKVSQVQISIYEHFRSPGEGSEQESMSILETQPIIYSETGYFHPLKHIVTITLPIKAFEPSKAETEKELIAKNEEKRKELIRQYANFFPKSPGKPELLAKCMLTLKTSTKKMSTAITAEELYAKYSTYSIEKLETEILFKGPVLEALYTMDPEL